MLANCTSCQHPFTVQACYSPHTKFFLLVSMAFWCSSKISVPGPKSQWWRQSLKVGWPTSLGLEQALHIPTAHQWQWKKQRHYRWTPSCPMPLGQVLGSKRRAHTIEMEPSCQWTKRRSWLWDQTEGAEEAHFPRSTVHIESSNLSTKFLIFWLLTGVALEVRDMDICCVWLTNSWTMHCHSCTEVYSNRYQSTSEISDSPDDFD